MITDDSQALDSLGEEFIQRWFFLFKQNFVFFATKRDNSLTKYPLHKQHVELRGIGEVKATALHRISCVSEDQFKNIG
jgi:hypothetical protein